MPVTSIEQFIQSPYNRFADIKMLKFFTQISMTAFIVLIILIILSVLIRNFWCRYLCPYGALLGLIGFLSLGRIIRNSSCCTSCGKCEKTCPGYIAIRKKRQIHSPECSACLTCIESCPEKNAIAFSIPSIKTPIHVSFLAIFFLFVFTIGITIAKLTDNWQNEISKHEYLSYLLPVRNNFNSIGQISPEKMQQMILMMKKLKEQQIRMQDLQKDRGN
jgi:polyferredoxin